MGYIDISIITFYFVIVIGTGIYLSKRASKNLEAYFLGGRGMHWLALSMSGATSTFDITGTMWIVSLIYIMGMKSMWVHWMWGVMMGAFFMSYMGKWVRRSNVVTGAEWMVTRFGNDLGGRIARLSYTFMAVTTLAGFIGYAFQGIGKFAAVYIPLEPYICGIIIIGTTTLYVLLGGLYGVVFTNVIQTVILVFSSIVIAVVAYNQLTPAIIDNSVSAHWFSLLPVWRLENLAGTENAQYELFGALVIVWVLKGFLLNAGGPAQMYDFQTFLAARNPRDASKLGAAWSIFLIVRWGMTMGITLLAITGIAKVTDPEQVMPIVLKQYLPVGFRGVVIAGLLAAFMSTFSATVNSAASYIVRDLWQPYFRPDAGEKQLVRAGYVSTISVVLIGIFLGMNAKSIAHIWNWLMMALGAGVIIPNMLRWYWWRMNGWGYAAGTITGILLSLIVLFFPEAPMYIYFPPIVFLSFAGCVIGSYAAEPTDEKILLTFYKTVRPFGFWHDIKKKSDLSVQELSARSENGYLTILNVLFGISAITGYYLFPMYLVGHRHSTSMICLGCALLSTLILKFTWYNNLPLEK
ncbi:sodium:solute symporter family protein [Candidatus Latescibacterota bacterium]